LVLVAEGVPEGVGPEEREAVGLTLALEPGLAEGD
jgi:hypothetical protein